MSSLTLTFRAPGEECIVLQALADAYGRVLSEVEAMRQEAGDDLPHLLELAGITDYATARAEKLRRRLDRAQAHVRDEVSP